MKTLAMMGCILLLAATYTAGSFLARSPGHAAGPLVDEIDYVAQLPRPADLVKNSEAPDGAKLSKIVQTRRDVTVTYAMAGGRSRVVSYRLLSNVGPTEEPVSAWSAEAASAPAPAAASAEVASAPAVAPAPAAAPAAVYYDNSPTNTIVNQAPAPVYTDAASSAAVYSQPAPAYYDATPDYPAAYQSPAPAYYYPPAYYGPAFAYYSRPIAREFPRAEPRSGPRATVSGGPREGFRTVGRR